jgi:hypothetical protein
VASVAIVANAVQKPAKRSADYARRLNREILRPARRHAFKVCLLNLVGEGALLSFS